MQTAIHDMLVAICEKLDIDYTSPIIEMSRDLAKAREHWAKELKDQKPQPISHAEQTVITTGAVPEIEAILEANATEEARLEEQAMLEAEAQAEATRSAEGEEAPIGAPDLSGVDAPPAPAMSGGDAVVSESPDTEESDEDKKPRTKKSKSEGEE
jgi:hypothetical protein